MKRFTTCRIGKKPLAETAIMKKQSATTVLHSSKNPTKTFCVRPLSNIRCSRCLSKMTLSFLKSRASLIVPYHLSSEPQPPRNRHPSLTDIGSLPPTRPQIISCPQNDPDPAGYPNRNKAPRCQSSPSRNSTTTSATFPNAASPTPTRRGSTCIPVNRLQSPMTGSDSRIPRRGCGTCLIALSRRRAPRAISITW